MPTSINLQPTDLHVGHWFFDPASGTFFNFITDEILPGSMLAGDPPSISQSQVHNTAMLMQIWDRTVFPQRSNALGNSGLVSGSAFMAFTEEVPWSEFILNSIPAGSHFQPGNPPRYPRLGNWAVVYASPLGGWSLGPTEYLTFERQTIVAQNHFAVGVWWRLNPGVTGTFVCFDVGTKRTGIVYRYPGMSEDDVCNPYTGAYALPQPPV